MQTKQVRDTVSTLAVIAVLSFLLNYVWESLHEAFLYKQHSFKAVKYVVMMLYVSTVDASVILGMYLGVAALWKDILWLREMKWQQAFVVCVAGMAIAAFIEYRSVLVLKEWSYTPLMPTIFGIGVSPLLQLSVTGLLTFWLTRTILFGKKDL
jgi:hypothetical protein